MAVIEQQPERPYTITEDGATHHRVFNIDANSEPDAQAELLAAKGVKIGAIYQNMKGEVPDTRLKCRSIEIDAKVPAKVSATGLYVAFANYEINQGSFNFEPDDDGAAKWYVEESLIEERVEIDIDGNLVGNSAGVPYADVTAPSPNEILRAEWVRSNQNFFTALQMARVFRGKVNLNTWKGAAPRNLLCRSFVPTVLDDSAFSTVGRIKFVARFEHKATRDILGASVPGWTRAELDRGRQERFAGVLIPITIADPDKPGFEIQVPDPVNLDGAGAQAAEGVSVVNQFKLIPAVEFGGIPI